jgi:sulfur carrier protein
MREPTTLAADEDLLQIWLNGEARSIASGLNLRSLLEELGRDPRTVAVEYNGLIVPRDEYSRTELRAGDRLEVVQFVQGG